MKIRYGGELRPGDFIAVSENSAYLQFGWYFGQGSGTLQYISIHSPGNTFEIYNDWKNGKEVNHWYKERFERHGFTSKLFYKSYIYGSGIDENGTRVMKIENPESVFTNPEDLEIYNKSKEALIHINFLQK